MEIEDNGELRSFESMPTEVMLYLTAVRYSGNYWAAGPVSTDKNEVIRMLAENYTGVAVARIYAVKVPVETISAS